MMFSAGGDVIFSIAITEALGMKPLVSILIPAYNAEEWIRYTLQSAVAQTWPRKEIIVLDDGSTDGTAEVAGQFASKGVKIVSRENRGLSAAVNQAYRLCEGDYIQELDSDDILGSRQDRTAAFRVVAGR